MITFGHFYNGRKRVKGTKSHINIISLANIDQFSPPLHTHHVLYHKGGRTLEVLMPPAHVHS